MCELYTRTTAPHAYNQVVLLVSNPRVLRTALFCGIDLAYERFGLDVHALDARGGRQGDGSGHQGHLGAELGQGLGDREARNDVRFPLLRPKVAQPSRKRKDVRAVVGRLE